MSPDAAGVLILGGLAWFLAAVRGTRRRRRERRALARALGALRRRLLGVEALVVAGHLDPAGVHSFVARCLDLEANRDRRQPGGARSPEILPFPAHTHLQAKGPGTDARQGPVHRRDPRVDA